MIDDQFRAWLDSRDFGPMSTASPLQATIVYNAIFPEAEKQHILDDHIIKYMNSISNNSIEFNIASSTCIVEDILLHLNVTELNEETMAYNNQQCIKFAQDLGLMKESCDAIGSKRKLEHSSTIEATLLSSKDNRSIHTDKSNSGVTLKTDQTDIAEIKKKSFVSAKEKFKSEGGVLKQASSNNKNNTNSGNISNVLRETTTKKFSNGVDDGESATSISMPPGLENCSKALVDKIQADIIHHGQTVTFDDIAGLDFAKNCVKELICWPMLRPDLFVGLRALPKGVLLFGPPGTGKTLIGKAIAHQAGATFFSISSSSLTSKWIGEGEATVRTLFAVATYHQPSVVFIDEVDSLLTQRSSEENEASRRIKTEFLVQLDGAGTSADSRVVILGATNRPEELDEAARRRFVKRLYIPLPDISTRFELLTILLRDCKHSLIGPDISDIVSKTQGFSGADIRSLCTEAAMTPLREIARNSQLLSNIREEDVPSVSYSHFLQAIEVVQPSVSSNDLKRYIAWNSEFGTYRKIE